MEELRLIGMEKRYEEKDGAGFSLQPVDLTVNEGEFFTLLGPSGCGKTTLLKLTAGLIEPDRGEIHVGDETLTSVPPEARGFAMVFQQSLLFPHMTVEGNVAFGLKMQGVGRKERAAAASEMLAHVGLEGYSNRFPDELSGGQQQRVALARALVTNPRVLLMDEPFSALDPGLRGEMRELLSRIQKEFRVTVLFVTHDFEEAFQLSDRIGVMADGELLQIGDARQLYEQPASTKVASFLGLKNIIEGRIAGSRFSASDGSADFAVGESDGEGHRFLIIRPEALELAEDGARSSDTVRFRGTVSDLKFSHGYHTGKVQVGTRQLDCRFSSRQAGRIAVGGEVALSAQREDLWFVEK